MPLLEAHQVTVEVKSPASPWFMTLLIDGLPFLLLIGLFFLIGRRASREQAGIFSFGRSQARTHEAEQPEVTFEDVAGADEAKQELQEVVGFLRSPDHYYKF